MTEELLTEESVEEDQESVKNVFLLKERFEIDFQKPLQNLNTNGALAFNVNDNICFSRIFQNL